MNVNTEEGQNATTPPDSARDFTSEKDSASPEPSVDSEADGRSSADTTPPPQLDGLAMTNASYRTLSKRYSSGSGFSRSYQSAPSFASSIPSAHGFGHYRQTSQDNRPPSSGKNATGQDDRDLAATLEMLSCSYGSNSGTRTVHLPPDAPPVPPLPRKYLDHAALSGPGGFMSSFANRAQESFTRSTRADLHHDDIKMSEITDDDDDDIRSRARSDEDDDGVFGRMEY